MAIPTRYPVIALDYSEKDKAVPKEVLIDYSNGNIYVVSATDKRIIFNVTEKILSQLDGLKADNITIIIDGVGEVNLTEFINQLNQTIGSTVHIKDPGADFSYIIRDNTIDNKSLKIFNGNIQMDNYTSADDMAIPQKTTTGLRWMPIKELIGGITISGNGDGYNEIDGNLKNVPMLINENNKIYLVSHAQKSYNVTGNFANVYLPNTVDEYSVIKWQLTQIQSNLDLIFEPNVYISKNILANTNITISYNGSGVKLTVPKCTDILKVMYKFQFETFDNGLTWVMDVKQFDNSQAYNK